MNPLVTKSLAKTLIMDAVVDLRRSYKRATRKARGLSLAVQRVGAIEWPMYYSYVRLQLM